MVPKDSPNIPGEFLAESESNVKFPKKLRFNNRGRPLATIYKRPDCYRLYWRQRGADGKPSSRFKDFTSYTAAKREGDKVVSDVAKGNAPLGKPLPIGASTCPSIPTSTGTWNASWLGGRMPTHRLVVGANGAAMLLGDR